MFENDLTVSFTLSANTAGVCHVKHTLDTTTVWVKFYIQIFSPDSEDYSLSVSSVVFTGATMECLTFELTPDDILEGSEQFTVGISDFGGALMGSITSATVTIEDDDGELCDQTAARASCEMFRFCFRGRGFSH